MPEIARVVIALDNDRVSISALERKIRTHNESGCVVVTVISGVMRRLWGRLA
jgi:hypothetical protein